MTDITRCWLMSPDDDWYHQMLSDVIRCWLMSPDIEVVAWDLWLGPGPVAGAGGWWLLPSGRAEAGAAARPVKLLLHSTLEVLNNYTRLSKQINNTQVTLGIHGSSVRHCTWQWVSQWDNISYYYKSECSQSPITIKQSVYYANNHNTNNVICIHTLYSLSQDQGNISFYAAY